MRRVVFNAILILGLITYLSACAKTTPESLQVTIEMTEYAFAPNLITAKVGQDVILEIVNQGKLSHEIMFGREVKYVNNRPSGYMVDLFETSGVEPQVSFLQGKPATSDEEHEKEHQVFMVVLPKTGDVATIRFTVSRDMVGEWEIGCFEQDGVHYDAGMKGKFVVLP